MTEPRKPGRPQIPPADKLVVVPVRMSEAQRIKFRAMPDGPKRLRDWVDSAK